MNRVQPENVHTTIFTPREYQVELVDACLRGNVLSVLASRSTRTFLITMVTRELAHHTRSTDHGGKDLRTLILGWSGPSLVRAGEAIQQNTNLAVTTYTTLDQVDKWVPSRWSQAFREAQVLIMTVDVLERGLGDGVLPFDMLNLLVVTDAHRMPSSPSVVEVLRKCQGCRILGMTSPVLGQSSSPPQLESFLSHLQGVSSCRVDTASEIVTVLRYVNKPSEKIVMCKNPSPEERSEVEMEVRCLVENALEFLSEHRYDLVEVYGPEYQEFCENIPDPNHEPRQILLDFLDVLNDLGLWCADRAALYSLVEVEKLKKKTAYDRHYLLLCMIFTVMARIRAVVEVAFESYSELEQILKFSSPKVLRLVEVLRQVRPLNFIDPRKRRDKNDVSEVRAELISEALKESQVNCMENSDDSEILKVNENIQKDNMYVKDAQLNHDNVQNEELILGDTCNDLDIIKNHNMRSTGIDDTSYTEGEIICTCVSTSYRCRMDFKEFAVKKAIVDNDDLLPLCNVSKSCDVENISKSCKEGYHLLSCCSKCIDRCQSVQITPASCPKDSQAVLDRQRGGVEDVSSCLEESICRLSLKDSNLCCSLDGCETKCSQKCCYCDLCKDESSSAKGLMNHTTDADAPFVLENRQNTCNGYLNTHEYAVVTDRNNHRNTLGTVNGVLDSSHESETDNEDTYDLSHTCISNDSCESVQNHLSEKNNVQLDSEVCAHHPTSHLHNESPSDVTRGANGVLAPEKGAVMLKCTKPKMDACLCAEQPLVLKDQSIRKEKAPSTKKKKVPTATLR